MRIFSEEVKHTFSNSPLNILQVANFDEIFFGVYEVELNQRKYPVEEVSKYNGNPVVSIPVMVEGIEKEYPFILLKGEEEIFFNESNTEIPESDMEVVEEEKEPDNEQLLIDIQNLKKEAVRQAQEELSKNTAILKERVEREKAKKEKALKKYLESARENLVDEFTNISQRIKNELISENDERFFEIKETIDNKIQDLADSLNESLKKDFNNSSRLIDKSIKQLVKDLYEKNINPKVDKELEEIAVEIVEKISEIDKNLNTKLDKKADVSLVEGVNREIDAIRDSNIELNNSLNKGIQKALSRVGNVDKKIVEVSEKFEIKIEETEKDVTSYFDEKLNLLKEETLDITDEARSYFQNLIQESRNGLLSEIRKIKNEKPVEYILETKNGESVVKDWDSIEKDWNKKIHDKIENVRTDLRKYVAVYASGGGTNAQQFADGGTMNGDLTVVGTLSASQILGINSNPVSNIIIGDGSTTVFTISGADTITNAASLIVAIDGALQEPEIDYTINGNEITFTSPVLSGARASVTTPNLIPEPDTNYPISPFFNKTLFKYNLEVGNNDVITFPLQTTYDLIQASFTIVFSTITAKNTLKFDCIINNGSVIDTGYGVMNLGGDLYSAITSVLSGGYLFLNVQANEITQMTIVGEAIYEPGIAYEGSLMIAEDNSILVSENSDVFVFE